MLCTCPFGQVFETKKIDMMKRLSEMFQIKGHSFMDFYFETYDGL